MEPLTIDVLLCNSCSNPEDFKAWDEWARDRNPDKGLYTGWSIFIIELHCLTYEIIARSLGDGKYEIREYTVKDN